MLNERLRDQFVKTIIGFFPAVDWVQPVTYLLIESEVGF